MLSLQTVISVYNLAGVTLSIVKRVCHTVRHFLKIKKAACIGNVNRNFVTSWNLELTKAEVQLMEILILEHVRKLSAIEEN